ncbi:uncharacterized protein LOC124157186 [Ischnura elegans]|uniref:uncharacterized protein LOC124157186 n=1 Tax=Ischnura elegans TaxID=197161 RepID=UPI001ED86CF5|nr:uncharacterized protein LOC124157186 [Ischnura elegans]
MYHGIACIFQELWYNPSRTSDGRTSLPSGKLYDQYTNICKELRKFGLRESRRGVKRPGEDISCDGSEDLARLLPCALSNEDVEERLQFLQTELNDWETINRYWQETVRHRQAKLRSDAAYEATYEYVNTYPVLKQPEGYPLQSARLWVIVEKALFGMEEKRKMGSGKGQRERVPTTAPLEASGGYRLRL